MLKALSLLCQLALYSLCLTWITSNKAVAQVTSDGTVNTQVDTQGNVSEITGGETSGGNLFHSFQDFSMGTGNEAFFNNADNISNIFSRVTGGNISNIDGLIRNNGSASLFLINPAGIIFGSGASLDIGGSFYGSSANSILFDEGEFSAVDNLNEPILTINAPIGLGFRDNPGDINVNQSTLRVNRGQTLALIGGNLSFDGASLAASGSRVELGGLTESEIVNINNDGSTNFPQAAARSDISFSDSQVFVLGNGGGSIAINARNLFLTSALSDASLIAGIAPDTGSNDAQAGDIVIDLTEDLTIDNSSITNSNLGTGNAGNVIIDARDITFNSGGTIVNFSNGQGDIGDTIISATGDITFDGITGNVSSGVTNFLTEEATGDIGEINLTAQNLRLTNGAEISSRVEQNNNSGNINLNIVDTISIEGSGFLTIDGTQTDFPSSVSSGLFDGNGNSGNININTTNLFLNEGNIQADNFGQGSSGDINLNVDSLSVTEGARIDSDVRGVGNGGNITINAQDTVSLIGNEQFLSTIRADISEDGIGEAGNIEINTRQLILDDGLISADVFGDGDGGTIQISAIDSIELSNLSFIQADVLEGSTGNSGNLSLETTQLTLNDGSQISATTFGSGNAGTVFINASESINLNGVRESSRGGILASALIEDGNGGNINLTTDRLTISDGAIITASNFSSIGEENGGAAPGTGEPGSIAITANSLSLESEGRIEAATQAETGTGANIDLQVADSVFLRGDSFISARALADADGGNINIDTNSIIAFPNGNNDIIATAQRGNGGNINIDTKSLLGIEQRPLDSSTNDLNASSEFSLDGSITIRTPDVSSFQNVIELPINAIATEETIAQACQGDQETATQNSFVVLGKGGIPATPDLPFDSQNISGKEVSSDSSSVETSQGKIQPARGIKIAENGDTILTAYRTSNSGERIPEGKINCR